MKIDKSLSIMLKMREKIRGEEPKCFQFGHVYISGHLASSVKASRYTSRISFAVLSIRSVPEFWALFHFIRASARKKIDVL